MSVLVALLALTATATASDAPTVVQAGVDRSLSRADGTALRLEGRGSVGRVGVQVGADWTHAVYAGDAVLPDIATRRVALRAAAGPRLVGPGGAEVMVHVGILLDSSAITGRTYRALAAQGFYTDAAAFGAGVGAGALGVLPFRPNGAWAFAWSVQGSRSSYWRLRQPLSRSRSSLEEQGFPPSDRRERATASVAVAPSLQLRVRYLQLNAGPTLRYGGAAGGAHPTLGFGGAIGVWTP
ncbi:MAG: hypothetical protein R3F59_01400 [Myxococcota bacterium]